MKKLLSLLLLVLVLIQGVLAVEVSINDYDPLPAKAGEYVDLWLKVENPSSKNVDAVWIEVVPKDGFLLAYGEVAKQKIGSLNSYDYTVIRYRLEVRDSALDGVNYLEVQLSQGDIISSYDLSIVVDAKDNDLVELEVADINAEPVRIRSGDDSVKLVVVVQNLGDTSAKGVKVELVDLPEGISFSESYSNRELLGNIPEDSSSSASFYIDVADEVQAGDYSASLMASYKFKPDADADEYSLETVNLPVILSIKPSPLFTIISAEIGRAKLQAGDKNIPIKIIIKNVGEKSGESVRVKVYTKSEQPFSFSVNNNFVAAKLEPGMVGEAVLEFNIDDDAALQTYLLDVEIKSVVDDDVLVYRKSMPVTVSEEKDVGFGKFVVVGVIIIVVIGLSAYLKSDKKRK